MVTERKTLRLEVQVDEKGVVTGFAKMGRGAQNFTRTASRGFRNLNSAINTLRAGIAGFFAFLAVRRTFNALRGIANDLDFIIKSSDRLQITTDSLQELQFVAGLAGIEFNTLANGLAIFSKNLQVARRGSIEQAQAFRDLGLSLLDIPIGPSGQVDIVELLAQAADGFTRLEDRTRAVNAVLTIFGRQGKNLGPLLQQGSAAIREQAEELRRIGVVFSEEQLGRAAQFNDALLRLNTAFRALSQSIFVDLAPRFSRVFDELRRLLVENSEAIRTRLGQLGQVFLDFAEVVGTAFIFTVNAIAKAGLRVREILGKIEELVLRARLLSATIFAGRGELDALDLQLSELFLRQQALQSEIRGIDLTAGIDEYKRLIQTLRDVDSEGRQVEDFFRRLPDAGLGARSIGTQFAEGFRQGLDNFREAATDFVSIGRQTFQNIARSAETNLTTAINVWITGTEKAKDAFRNLANSVLRDLSRIVSQIIAQQAILSLTSLFAGASGAAGAAGAGGLSAPRTPFQFFGVAKGGVLHGPVQQVPGYQRGGIIGREGLFRAGEGGRPEGVLPLARTPGGELGVQAVGAGINNNVSLTINLASTDSRGGAVELRQQANSLLAAIVRELNKNNPGREQMRRAIRG